MPPVLPRSVDSLRLHEASAGPGHGARRCGRVKNESQTLQVWYIHSFTWYYMTIDYMYGIYIFTYRLGWLKRGQWGGICDRHRSCLGMVSRWPFFPGKVRWFGSGFHHFIRPTGSSPSSPSPIQLWMWNIFHPTWASWHVLMLRWIH